LIIGVFCFHISNFLLFSPFLQLVASKRHFPARYRCLKTNQPHHIRNQPAHTYGLDIYADGNDVYVFGKGASDCCWKNGIQL